MAVALVDCNNFYVSCERAFNPRLEKQPVVVLSNNDGCVISRSNEAKKLGIPMGAPFFKWQAFCKANGVKVFSSNYELYGDMSHRIMQLLTEECPQIEVYSIDEAFLSLADEIHLTEKADIICKKIKSCLSIPISIGIASTKTLAKIANHIAKHKTEMGVYQLTSNNLPFALSDFPVEKIWGIGRKLSVRLNHLGIHTAWQLYQSDAKQLRIHFNVMVEKIVQEIQGRACLSLETVKPRQQIISSRSFGTPITHLEALEEAISHYATVAASKLRKQKSVTHAIGVFIQTNIFQGETKRYENTITFPFPIPTADTRDIIRVAKKCIKRIYRPGYRYHKAGIILFDIMPARIKQHDMLTHQQEEKSQKLMAVVDKINSIKGKNIVFYCAEGIGKNWKMRSERRSPRYTTHWDELLEVK